MTKVFNVYGMHRLDVIKVSRSLAHRDRIFVDVTEGTLLDSGQARELARILTQLAEEVERRAG